MCFNKLTWCDSANMSLLTKMERTGCDAQTTIQMRPANQHLSDNDSHSSTNGKYPQHPGSGISHPTLTAEVHCSRYYSLLLWRLKGLFWIWMRAALSRGRRGTWVFSGVFAVFRVRYGGAVQCHRLAMWHFLPSLPGYVNVRCWAEHCAIVGTQGSICGKSAGRTAGSVSECKIGRWWENGCFLDRCSCVLGTSWALYPSGREALLEYRLVSARAQQTVLSVDTIACDTFPRSSRI